MRKAKWLNDPHRETSSVMLTNPMDTTTLAAPIRLPIGRLAAYAKTIPRPDVPLTTPISEIVNPILIFAERAIIEESGRVERAGGAVTYVISEKQ
jgi:hypothetical protein